MVTVLLGLVGSAAWDLIKRALLYGWSIYKLRSARSIAAEIAEMENVAEYCQKRQRRAVRCLAGSLWFIGGYMLFGLISDTSVRAMVRAFCGVFCAVSAVYMVEEALAMNPYGAMMRKAQFETRLQKLEAKAK